MKTSSRNIDFNVSTQVGACFENVEEITNGNRDSKEKTVHFS